MGDIRRRTATAAAIGLTTAAIAAVTATTPASAAPGSSLTSPGAHTYTFTTATDSSTTSSGVLAWDNSTWALSATVTTGQLASGSCVTVYFDWNSKGHHDARAVRDCAGNDTYTATFTDANTSNLVAGPQRMGICYGTADTVGTCTTYGRSSNIPMDWTPWPQTSWSYPCVLSFARKAGDGTTTDVVDTHPQRRVAVNGTC